MKKEKKVIMHFFTVTVFMLFITLGLGSTCSSTPPTSAATIMRTQSKMYMDIMGFNDNVILPFISGNYQRPPHNMETQIGIDNLLVDIQNLPGGANTAAYYALDIGLDRIAYVKKNFMDNDPNSKYYIIFLTDGLDNVSVSLAQRNGRGVYNNTAEYAEILQERMKTNLIDHVSSRNSSGNTAVSLVPSATNTFQSYVLLYKGNDIIRSGYTDNELNQLLMPFTGSQNEQRPPIIMSDNLNQLYEEFEKELSLSFSFVIPKGYEELRIRMLLNPDKGIWFEGKLVREIKLLQSGRNEVIYSLEDITTSEGFTFNYDGTIVMDKSIYNNNSNIVPFIIDDLKLNNKPYVVKRNDNVQQWFYDGNKLRLNSEFEAINRKNAYILFIMDTSFSFKEQIDTAKDTIKKIITYMKDQM